MEVNEERKKRKTKRRRRRGFCGANKGRRWRTGWLNVRDDQMKEVEENEKDEVEKT